MFTYRPIGIMRTCFRERFGVPRQSLMIAEARGVLKLREEPQFREALNHLSSFSHIWILFAFDQVAEGTWHPTIRPPRVDAPRRVGVFASRSPHRPNPIGISAVKLDRIDFDAKDGIEIHLSGVDLLDGTPVLDIKPYLPYADGIAHASAGWATGEIPRYSVEFDPEALRFLEEWRPQPESANGSLPRSPLEWYRLIVQTLEWDPRPTSQRRAMPMSAPESQGLAFGFRIQQLEVRWEIRDGRIRVTGLSTD
jgi:tRNA-Thr(GGU) m(6)t(6)A37 methyltransferase TsaA